jgi:hypothetical protein
MTWTQDDPGAGDTHGVRAVGRRLDSAVRSLADVHFGVRSDSGTLTAAAWEGRAGDGWREQSDACVRDLGGLIEVLAEGSTALTAYANAVEGIAEEVVLVRARRVAAGADLARAMQQLGMPTSLPKNGVATPAEVARQSRVRRQARDAAQVAVDRADQEMAELVDRRVAADSTVQAALGVIDIADWRAVGRASAAAGLTSPDMIGGDATRGVLVSLALDVLDGNASMADLARLLVAWGRDEEVLSGFFLSLGGGRTVALVEVLAGRVYRGEGTEVEARAQALALVSALSVGSAGWSGGQADRFVEQMTEHGRWPGAVGFLFGSAQTAPMGASFTVAMANHIDDYERLRGEVPQWQPSDGGVLANLLYPERAGRAGDPMSGVLETLGRYPRAALDWLLRINAGAPFERIDFWIGERDWTGDGFLGVASLWSGIQALPGGPADAGRYDQDAWTQLAIANTIIARRLGDNPHALAETISAEGQIQIATALGQMMPLLAYCVNLDVGAGTFQEVVLPFANLHDSGVSQTRPIPALDRQAIADIFGLAGASSAGRDVLTAGVRHAQQAMVDAAVVAVGGEDLMLTGVGSLQALLDGALSGAALGIEQRTEERYRKLVDLAVGVIDMVPLPGSGKAADVLSHAAADAISEAARRWVEHGVEELENLARERTLEAISLATSGGSSSVGSGTWAATLDAASAGGGGTRESLIESLSVWNGLLEMAKPERPAPLGGVDQYLLTITSNYSNIYDSAESAAANHAK